MRFIQFTMNADPHKKPRVGVRVGRRILDVETKYPEAPHNLKDLISELPSICDDLLGSHVTTFQQDIIKLEDVTLLPPVTGSDKVICVGMNYKDHCEEQGVPVPKDPIFFSKFASCIIGPYDSIPYPEATEELDYEVELAVVIGKTGKNIPEDSAYDYIWGYTVAHDVSARDWQLKKNGGQWLIGKAMDGFCPLGPEIVTKDEIGDPHNLKILCSVNGEIKQDSNTNQLVHKVDYIISMLSKFVTLLPGDVILTGTPPGVGVFANPPFFLKRGDVVKCEIEKIGHIINKIE